MLDRTGTSDDFPERNLEDSGDSEDSDQLLGGFEELGGLGGLGGSRREDSLKDDGDLHPTDTAPMDGLWRARHGSSGGLGRWSEDLELDCSQGITTLSSEAPLVALRRSS